MRIAACEHADDDIKTFPTGETFLADAWYRDPARLPFHF